MLTVGLLVVALSVPAGSAKASSGFKLSFLGQSHTAQPGSAWGYYIRAWENGRPWQGIVKVDVQTPKGKIIDDVGRYPFKGSLLDGYLWNHADRGLLLFKVVFTQDGRTVGQATYPVRVV